MFEPTVLLVPLLFSVTAALNVEVTQGYCTTLYGESKAGKGWTKDGNPISHGNKIEIDQDFLELCGASKSDVGQYTSPDKTKTFTLKVLEFKNYTVNAKESFDHTYEVVDGFKESEHVMHPLKPRKVGLRYTTSIGPYITSEYGYTVENSPEFGLYRKSTVNIAYARSSDTGTYTAKFYYWDDNGKDVYTTIQAFNLTVVVKK